MLQLDEKPDSNDNQHWNNAMEREVTMITAWEHYSAVVGIVRSSLFN